MPNSRLDLENPGYLLTVVEDSGPGIPQKDFKTLFSMFNTSTCMFKTKGIGLGLSTAKNLSQALLGGIHLNSKQGQGSEVGFSILTQREPIKIYAKRLKEQAIQL